MIRIQGQRQLDQNGDKTLTTSASSASSASGEAVIDACEESLESLMKSRPEDKLKVGDLAPDFILNCPDGETHKLSDYRGMKIMICFYCAIHCPVIAYNVNRLIGTYKKLAWAARLKVIIVFRSSNGILREGIKIQESSFKKDKDVNEDFQFPFLGLADTDGAVFSRYQVSSKLSTYFLSAVEVSRMKAKSKEYGEVAIPSSWCVIRELATLGAGKLLPSEFLVDKDGKIAGIFRAKKPGQTMDIDRITHFLLDQQYPSEKDAKNKKKVSV